MSSDEQGPGIAPDTEKFIAGLDMAQIKFLITVIEHGGGAIAELWLYSADRWNALQQAQRDTVAHECRERFFTEKAFEEYRIAGERHAMQEFKNRQRTKAIFVPPKGGWAGGGRGGT